MCILYTYTTYNQYSEFNLGYYISISIFYRARAYSIFIVYLGLIVPNRQ